MKDDTFQITGFAEYDDPDNGSRQTVQFDYQINGEVYSTEHYLDSYGDPPTPDELTAGLQDWVIKVAKPQLKPEPVVPADLEALIQPEA